MQQRIKKWGNGAAVRLPVSILNSARLSIDANVDIQVKDGRIVIQPSRPKRYRLNDLIDGITEENRHAAVDTGVPRGEEAF